MIIDTLKLLTKHSYIQIVSRGNAAIKAALNVVNGTVLIPSEGGWLKFKEIPKELGLDVVEVECDDAVLNLDGLEKKLEGGKVGALLYQNPGGYFTAQSMKEIYNLCKEHDCLVILDVSGSIGTKMCDGRYADIIVGSFGRWKLVDVGKGGFISCNNDDLWNKLKENIIVLKDNEIEEEIAKKLELLPHRIDFLLKKRKKIIEDLADFDIVRKDDEGFVVVVRYNDESEKEKIVNYCKKEELEWTQCPRYIRLNAQAISIEVKRVEGIGD